MRGENRIPIPCSCPCRSVENNLWPEKGGAAGTTARESDRSTCCNPIRLHRREARRNRGKMEELRLLLSFIYKLGRRYIYNIVLVITPGTARKMD
ncbi:hypothetical protein NDU88_006614 [Pleurodeles waltl]|uniref:Uncharacterized protein n=1 Tax=Pleurodeles waltl TaxID=8319 RepID=A0AAV7UQI2_PLEWA|nr:hypothetical protein NDU88_006614 [Pleurodeles waltl]